MRIIEWLIQVIERKKSGSVGCSDPDYINSASPSSPPPELSLSKHPRWPTPSPSCTAMILEDIGRKCESKSMRRVIASNPSETAHQNLRTSVGRSGANKRPEARPLLVASPRTIHGSASTQRIWNCMNIDCKSNSAGRGGSTSINSHQKVPAMELS